MIWRAVLANVLLVGLIMGFVWGGKRLEQIMDREVFSYVLAGAAGVFIFGVIPAVWWWVMGGRDADRK